MTVDGEAGRLKAPQMDRTTNLRTCSASTRWRARRRLVGLGFLWTAFGFCLAAAAQPTVAQVFGVSPPQAWGPAPKASPEARRKARELIGEWVGTDLTLDLDPRYSKILRTKKPVSRISITNPDVLEVTQFSPTEFELIGTRVGQTNLTLWFAGANGQGEGEMLRYLVRVYPDLGAEEQQKIEYSELERRINELFPNSSVQLIPVADKLLVRGEARDSREAGEIMSILRGESGELKAVGTANPQGGANPQLAPVAGGAAPQGGGPPILAGTAVASSPASRRGLPTSSTCSTSPARCR